MPFIAKSSIQELNNRLDAVAVASDYVQLEKRGGRYWARCPFHEEKTGSFTVNPELKNYYCFGCHKGGSIIGLVMEMDKLTYPETLELLAKRFGVKLVYENSGGANFSAGKEEAGKKLKEELFELYQRIAGTFHHFLLNKNEAAPAKQYVVSRGINSEMIERFRLGYAPADRRWLYRFLTKKGFSPEFLDKSGLFFANYPGVAFFSNRLIFPIADRQGRIAAFGGRALPGSVQKDGREPPKYLNSENSAIFTKRETLFGLDLAVPEIRKTKTVYLAEGYMDVIALHQAGVTNAVAPLGTAFTGEQAKLLKRWAERLVFFADTDEAGQTAAVKGILSCRKNGLVSALAVSGLEAKDPADILQKYGPETLKNKAKSVILDFDYLLKRAVSLYDISGSEGKARAAAFLFPYLDALDSELVRVSCIETAADSLGLLPAAVAEEYRRHVSGRLDGGTAARTESSKEEDYSRQSGGKTGSPIRLNDELALLLAVAVNYVSTQKEKLFPKFRASLEIIEIEDPNAKELCITLEECIRYGETGTEEFLARIASPGLKQFFMEHSATGEFSVNSGQLVDDGIQKLKEKKLKRRQEEIIINLRSIKKKLPNEDHGSEAKELLAEKMQIDNELHNLKLRKTNHD